MASSGPNFPGTVTTETGPSGDNDWTNPGNVGADDGSEAQITAATYDAGDHSFRLRARNFGFSIPAGATIDGILVEIERRDFAGDAQDQEVRLFDSTGTLVGDDKQTATSWPATATIASYGGAADTWAAGLDVDDINSANFGVALIVLANSANTDIGVDFIRVTITYTPSPDVTVTPSPVAVPIVIPAPTLQRGIVRTPSPVTVPIVIPTPARIHAGSTYEALVLADGPIRYYRLGEASGTVAVDETGTSNGEYVNAPTLGVTGAISGDPDTAVTLNGSDEFVRVFDAAALDFTTGPLSIEAWIKFDGTNGSFGDTIFGKGTLTPFFWLNTSDVLTFSKSDEGDIMSGGTISDTNWHHVVAVYENGVAGEIYLDGVAVGGSVTDRTFVANSTDAAFGSKYGSGATDPWGGSLDECAIYNRILTAQEVLDHYNEGIGAGPVEITPTPVQVPIVVPAPTLQVGITRTPDPVAVPIVVPTPTVQIGKVVTPSPVAVPIVVPVPSVQVEARVTPSPVTVPLVFPDITVAIGGGGGVTITPDPVTVPIVIPAPSVQASRIMSPDPVAVPIVVPAPTIQIGKTLNPDPVAIPILVPAPTIQIGKVVTPDPVAIPLVIVTPAIQVGTQVTPSPVVVQLVIPVPAVTANSAIPPGFLDELIELAVATGGVVTISSIDIQVAGVTVTSTLYGLDVDPGDPIELEVEG